MTTTATTATATNVATVESIGRRAASLEKSTATVAAAIVAAVADGYDWSKRGAVPAAIHLFAVGTTDKGSIPAQKKDDGSTTAYGKGVDMLRKAVADLVKGEPAESAPTMRVSLKGTGSAVVPADHPAYALLLALLGESPDADDAASE